MDSSFDPHKPLLGLTAAIACSKTKLEELSGGLEQLGARVLPVPVIELQALEDTSLLDKAIKSLNTYDWIVFTSAHGVRFFLQHLGLRHSRFTPLPKICAIGPGTARALNEAGYAVSLIPEAFIAEGVVDSLKKYAGGCHPLSGQHFLIPRAREGRDVIPAALNAAGAQVDVVPCYRNVKPQTDEDLIVRLKGMPPDLFVFTSSSTVRNMIDILGPEDGNSILLKTVVAVLGPVTGGTLESFGKRAEIVPGESTIASLLKEICAYFIRNHSTVDRQQ